MTNTFLKQLFLLCIIFGVSSQTTSAAELSKVEVKHNTLHGITPSVEVFIDGFGPYNFVVDTGATQSTIARDLVEKLDLKTRSQTTKSVFTPQGVEYPDVVDEVTLEISQQKIRRETSLDVTDIEQDPNDPIHGIIGLSELIGGKLVNDPVAKKIYLYLPTKNNACNYLTQESECKASKDYLQFIPFSLGAEKGRLLIDTGYNGSKKIYLLNSSHTKKIWETDLKDVGGNISPLFDGKTSKNFRTDDFSFPYSQNCQAEFLIHNPIDENVFLSEFSGVIGWAVLKDLNFTIDYTTNSSNFTDLSCPWSKVKTLGISGIEMSLDNSSMFIKDLDVNSPAAEAGLKLRDEIIKIELENGVIIDRFDRSILEHNDQHIYAPDGTVVVYYSKREDVITKHEITARGQNLISFSVDE